jgi:hypothetical protein
VNFFVPGTTVPGLTRGFGAVFTHAALLDTTSLTFFGANNESLGTFFVPSFPGAQTLSFLGVDFGLAEVSRVRITSGNVALAPGQLGPGVTVMDDFIYGEPIGVPGPIAGTGFVGLIFAGGALLVLARRRRQTA